MLGNLSSCIHVYVTFKYATHLKMIADHAPSPLLAHDASPHRHKSSEAAQGTPQRPRGFQSSPDPNQIKQDAQVQGWWGGGVVVTPVLILWLINV